MHHRLIADRRVDRLAAHVAPLIPSGARVLDLGAGDGAIALAVMRRRQDIELTALEVKPRDDALVPELEYDGRTIPFGDGSFDCVLLIDVVHHAWQPERLLAEAARVAGRRVVLKDHLADAFGSRVRLRLMDWISNAKHGIAMPYTYWTAEEWRGMFMRAGLEVESWCDQLHLYPQPASLVFDGSLQFLANLKVQAVPEAHGTSGPPA